MMKKIITFGTFDLLHEGHINILQRAKSFGDWLVVGVSSDELNLAKGKESFYDEEQRVASVKALEYVDEVFIEESLELKDEYISRHGADLLIMGDDWEGKFDWVSCEVKYLPRTQGISSTNLKNQIEMKFTNKVVLFCDTYIEKHYECALTIINEFIANKITPVITNTRNIPLGIKCDALVFFNRPSVPIPIEYRNKPKILIDHGASNLKWFLANKSRVEAFDYILTAGPDHKNSLLSFFPSEELESRVKSVGFIKAKKLHSKEGLTRAELCEKLGLDDSKPIVAFLPTWHISANHDMQIAIEQLRDIENHIACLHPETRYIDTKGLRTAQNENGIVTDIQRLADVIISDLSSTLFESAALGKNCVQLLFREYSDNNATFFDFPYVSGTSELFCAGKITRPPELQSTVNEVLSMSPQSLLSEQMAACRTRICKGSYMEVDAVDKIAAAVHEICSSERQNELKISESVRQKGLVKVHNNMDTYSNLLIGHAAGDYNGLHASNSQEAIIASQNVCNFIELDLVRLKDGIGVCHDGFEAKYGFDKPFAEIKVEDFISSKFAQLLQPLQLRTVFSLLKPKTKVVFDIKDTKENYKEVAATLFEYVATQGRIDDTIVQCYELQDFEYCKSLGYKHVILAVWKYFYKNPLGKDSFQFINNCLDSSRDIVVGISIPFINKHMETPALHDPRLFMLQSTWKRIYLHGAPVGEYPKILRENIGIFLDKISFDFEFKDIDDWFRWKEYLFLNPSLVKEGIDNQISAIQHYYKYGKQENRIARYEVPSDFNWAVYVDMNPDLRKFGISGVDSAKAHYTTYGAQENRKYKRD